MEAFTDTACGAWIMQEVMNYYNHTGDKEFLKESGFYMLKETAKFFNSFMTQYTADDGKNLLGNDSKRIAGKWIC